MARKYQRRTNYRPYAERQFSIRPVFRDPPDLEKLTAAYLRYALVRYERACAEHEQCEPKPVSLPAVAGPCPDRQGGPLDQPCDDDLSAISYVRVASAEVREVTLAVDAQRGVIAAAARRLGLRLTEEFADVGYSGLSLDRPALRRLLDHVASRQVGYCIVASLDRFSEDPEHAADIDEALSEAEVAIVVARDHIGEDT